MIVEIIYLILSIVAFIAWTFSFYRALGDIRRIFNSFLYETVRAPIVEKYVNILNIANLDILQTAQIFFNRYGPIFIYFSISIICLFFVLKRIRNRKIKYLEISYSIQFFAGIALAVIFLFGDFIEYDPIRVSRYAILMATILCGIVTYEIINRTRRKINRGLIVASLVFMICLVSILGIFNIYTSPYTSSSNAQLTHMEKNGINWFLENRNKNISLITGVFFLEKNEIYYFGRESAFYNKGKFVKDMIPTHFGYDENKTKFLTRDNCLVEFDSFLMNDLEIEQAVKQAGFTSLQMYDLNLPPDVEGISDHILIPARVLGLNVYTLPIVKLIIARK